MTMTATLRDRIEHLLAEVRTREESRATAREDGMEVVEATLARFDALARRWMQEIIFPRLATMASVFPNARPPKSSASAHRATVTLDPCEDDPVSARLDVVLEVEPARACVRVRVCPSIIPILMDYDGETAAEVGLDRPDDNALEQFLEERIVRFVADYLRVREPESAYQRDHLVTDPVCGMALRRAEVVARHEFESSTYYFCSSGCRARFEADPARYSRPSRGPNPGA